LILRRGLPAEAAARYSSAAALAAAFFVGYALLPDWASLRPERHWHWLPYLCLAAMVAGPVAIAPGVMIWERWLLFVLISIAAAWLLVPSWSGLQPPRPAWIAILAGGMWSLAAALDALPERLRGPWFLLYLMLTAMAVAIGLAAGISLKYGQIAGIAAAALGGLLLARQPPLATRGLILCFMVLVGSIAFVGCIEPQQPRFALILMPLAPLALWLFAFGPLAKLPGKTAGVTQTFAVLVPLIGALAIVLLD
jgi:hypothetical protein